MSESERSDGIGLPRKREAAISRLCESFARDQIELEEFERLVDRAHRAATVSELEALVGGLPAPVPASGPARLPTTSKVSDARESVVAIMGGAERRGTWVSSRRLTVYTVMGGALLDFRDAVMPEGETVLEIYALMGGVEVLVPPGLRVASDGVGIMGAFEHNADPSTGLPPEDAPLLRVTGFSLMSGVEITERLPGESARDARRRRKRKKR